MTALDYCTAAEAFAYGNSAGNATTPVNEATVMADLVTGVSRAIDRRCQQAFSQDTYTAQVLRGVVDKDGTLSCNPPVPTLATPTAAAYRVGNDLTWTSLDLAGADVLPANHGATLRFLGQNLLAARFGRIQVRIDYVGGWTQAQIPDDLAWAARAASWYEYKRRTASMDQSAIPELGIVTVPGDWPPFILRKLTPFTRVVSS